jgi:DNA replication ATP-dependent helicase Dna2
MPLRIDTGDIYEELESLVKSGDDFRKSFRKCFKIIRKIYNRAGEQENRFFPSFYSLSIFLNDKIRIPKPLALKINEIRKADMRFASGSGEFCGVDYLRFAVNAAVELLGLLGGSLESGKISEFIKFAPGEISIRQPGTKAPKLSSIFCTVAEKGEQGSDLKGRKRSVLNCENPELGNFDLLLYDVWEQVYTISRPGDELHLVNVSQLGKSSIIAGGGSIVVYQPDYLTDVTEIAECFSNKGFNPNIHLLKRYFDTSASYALVVGNLVNSIFDELIKNPDVDFESAYNTAIKAKPLQLIAVSVKEKDKIGGLKNDLQRHFENLKFFRKELQEGSYSIEPTFISPVYGLQGRLDLLVEYPEIENRKDIIELKSGRAPSPDIVYSSGDKTVRTGTWFNHQIQATGYNLLLDSGFRERTGDSAILYSGTNEYPLRNVANDLRTKINLVAGRNMIVFYEMAIARGNLNPFKKLNSQEFGEIPPFMGHTLAEFENTLAGMSEVERDWFFAYNIFLRREMAESKSGFDPERERYGFSSLWRENHEEKAEAMAFITGLKPDYSESDLSKMHLVFSRNDNSALSPFRRGDIAILHSGAVDNSARTFTGQALKCVIKEITGEKITISLRNKMLSENLLKGSRGSWSLEPDLVDSNFKRLFASLFAILRATREKRDKFFGLAAPEFLDNENFTEPELNENQNELLNSALRAKDYFLIQGPPGTGKTSYMLRFIAKNIFFRTDENILVISYTNRAVDEIAKALRKIGDGFTFLRFGSRESTDIRDELISEIAAESGVRPLWHKMKETRVFIGTSAALLANPELLDIKKFGTVIIDEASQLLEPHLAGITAQCGRFIMIGDEKQLPAVVVQPSEKLNTEKPSLRDIGLTNLGISLFDRLLQNAARKGWSDAFGMLSKQARMHSEIMHLANKMFYSGGLEIFDPERQNSIESLFDAGSEDSLEKAMAQNRVIFIDTPREDAYKVNQSEIFVVSRILKIIQKRVPGMELNTAGVISPFRIQCAEITKIIPEELRQKVIVDTVERFQGSEKEVIILSFAVNKLSDLRIVSSRAAGTDGKIIDRKLNVAITRARQNLVILGNKDILEQDTIFRELISNCKILKI